MDCNDKAHFEVAVTVVREEVSCDCNPGHKEESGIAQRGARTNDPGHSFCGLQVAVQEYRRLQT